MILINELNNNISCYVCKSNVNNINDANSYSCDCNYLCLKYIDDDECELIVDNLIVVSLLQSQIIEYYFVEIMDYYKHHIIINYFKNIHNMSVYDIVSKSFNLQEMFLNRIDFLITNISKIKENLLFE